MHESCLTKFIVLFWWYYQQTWFILHTCMHVQSFQSCLTLCEPMDCSPPGSSVHGILQAGILEWVAMPSSKGSSQPRARTHISYVSCTGRQFFTTFGEGENVYWGLTLWEKLERQQWAKQHSLCAHGSPSLVEETERSRETSVEDNFRESSFMRELEMVMWSHGRGTQD